jgi:hypothetical protein
MNRRNRTILLIFLIASALFAADDEYRAQVERFRRSNDEFLRSPQSPLLLVGRYKVNEGLSTLGSDPQSTIVLPTNAPRHVGTVVRHGNQFVFQPAADIYATCSPRIQKCGMCLRRLLHLPASVRSPRCWRGS